MMKESTFYYCADSNSFLLDIEKSSSRCRSEGLKLLEANTVDAAVEKHVPVIRFSGGKLEVNVRELPHPMLPEHYIQWIFIQTTTGGSYHQLLPGDTPEAIFLIKRDDILGVYAYCNLHGLWKADRSNVNAS